MAQNYYSSRSPPPLQHPVPTHPAFIPEPPSTPASPHGYQRYSSEQQSHPPPQTYASYGQPSYMNGPQQPQQHGQPSHLPPQQANTQQQQAFGVKVGQEFAQWGVNPSTAQLGMQLGHSAMAAGQEYVQKNLGGIIPLTLLKHHFNVSNTYVLAKLRLVLFPWRHRPWTRKSRRSESGQTEYQSPREDVNSPDLYIPSMALVTYVLLVGLQRGLRAQFDPEILGITASKALAVVLGEFVLVKLGCYLLNIQGTSQVTDLVAYCGYKFVGVTVIVLASIAELGRMFYWPTFIYTALSNAFFLLRSLRFVLLPDPSQPPGAMGTVSPAQRKLRLQFLFFIAVSQAFYMFILI